MRTKRTLGVSAIAGGVLAATIAGALAGEAQAADRWSTPHAGVQHLHRRVGPFDYHLVRVDLRTSGARIVATDESVAAPHEGAKRAGHRWTTVSSFARDVHADIAINANYYDLYARRFSTCGLTRSAGHTWRSSYEDHRLECDDSIGFGEGNRAEVFDSAGMLDGTAQRLAWMTTVVTGSPRLLRDGDVEHYTFPRHALSRNPRTAIGLSRDRGTLFLLVVNGREGRAQGMTCEETARVLRNHGAWDAVNLDGGGSSALYVRRERGIVSRFADGAERAVGNHIGVVFDAPPAAPSAKRFDAATSDSIAQGKSLPPQGALNAAFAAATESPSRTGRAVFLPSIERPRARAPRAPRGRGSWLAFGFSTVAVGFIAMARRRKG